MVSTARTKERAIAGRTRGLVILDDVITWEAVHLGIKQRLTVKITEVTEPHYFKDEMLKGAFSKMWHEHRFEERGDHTLMTDIFFFKSPLGFLGALVDRFFLRNYMEKFLLERNNTIKHFAETDKWKELF